MKFLALLDGRPSPQSGYFKVVVQEALVSLMHMKQRSKRSKKTAAF